MAAVPLTDAQHFTAKRRAIRAALAEDGIAAEIEALVDALLAPLTRTPIRLVPWPLYAALYDKVRIYAFLTCKNSMLHPL